MMDIQKTRFRLEDAGLMTTYLSDLMNICGRNVATIEEFEMKSIFFIASAIAASVSKEIGISFNELIEENK